ncbi:lipid-A-disaccharide synthase [Caulobacter mirabilis]|uniref:Lipid-A-disaccharide synthase n=1 Tax=Caulobacter mirabilis TaxID=69666 RepID=A0A2D2AXV4_9CAUL|nr:lipid-A-disaccharide synthase [Caulobacter mirabilis]ATQ42848.1 lipid-A-disaccharide synthase [Caulobacter mirabilis]
MTRPLTVMLAAAEASGDSLGAGLARALKARLSDGVRFVGVGGSKMAAEGVQSPFDIADLSILGLFEAIPAYPRIRRRVAETAALAARERPDVAILIDSWGFTLRVAHAIRKASPNTLLVKYVGPQVWATRPGRAKVLAKAVDHLLTIHSFDAPYFEKEGLPTTFVGNPALAKDFSKADPARLRTAIGAGPDDPILLVLPGSRPAEIKLVMPAFEDAVNLLKDRRPALHVVIPAAGTVAEAVKARVAGWPYRAHVIEDEQLKDDAFVAATVALACSGTVTTELALAHAPMVIGYRLGALTYGILKLLFKPPWITMFNIAARDFVAPEFVQDACNGPALAKAVGERLDDAGLRSRQIAAQDAALEKMGRGGPDPSEIAADTVLKLLAERGN